MRQIIAIIKNIIQREPSNLHKPVGRWRIEKTNKQLNMKIDLSNEDHCGPCGQYALKKIEIQDKDKKIQDKDKKIQDKDKKIN